MGYINEKCNGWRNWATWKVALILANDEGYYYMIQEWVEDYAKRGMTKAQAKAQLAEDIEGMVTEEYEEMISKGSLMATEIAVSIDWLNIDWERIAETELPDDYRPEKGKTASRSNNLKSSKGGKKPTKNKPKKKGGSKFSLPSINKSRKHRWDSTIWTTNRSGAP